MSSSIRGNVTLGVVLDTSANNSNYFKYGCNTAKVRVFSIHGFDPKIMKNIGKLSTTYNEEIPWIKIQLPPGTNPEEEQGLYQFGDIVYVQCASTSPSDLIVVGLYQTNNPLNLLTYNYTIIDTPYSTGTEYSYNPIESPLNNLGPLQFPLSDGTFRVTGWFGYEPGEAYGHPGSSRFHKGVDLGAKRGTPIYAAHAGKVSYVRYTIYDNKGGSGYGNYCKITSTDENYDECSTIYAHQSKVVVKKGDIVQPGDIIGEVGTTGDSTGNHLHFEIILANDRTRQDPFDYFPATFSEHLSDSPRFDDLNDPRLHFYTPD